MPDPDVLLLILPLLLLIVLMIVRGVDLRRALGRQQARVTDLEQQLTFIRQGLSGLTAGSAGVDGRLHTLEDRARRLAERQDTVENQSVDDQPYAQAIRLVQNGAGPLRLVQELDISESEAELIVRLHGTRDSA